MGIVFLPNCIDYPEKQQLVVIIYAYHVTDFIGIVCNCVYFECVHVCVWCMCVSALMVLHERGPESL